MHEDRPFVQSQLFSLVPLLQQCNSCKLRKSRCELVTSAGCRRCCVLGTICSFRTLPGLPGSDSEEQQTLTTRTVEGSREASPAREESGAVRRNSKRARSPQFLSLASTANIQHDARIANNESLEEVRKRTRRLELMMELMLEQNSKTELAALHQQTENLSSQGSSDLERRGSHSSDERITTDMEYSTSAGFLPLSKLMKPGKLSWANPLEALGLEDRWPEICSV